MDKNFGRNVLIILLVLNAWLLLHYAPLVPKAIILMDDIHDIRLRTTGWERTAEDIRKLATGIQSTLASLEKRFNFFKAEMERQGRRNGGNPHGGG